jgi:glycosyltransferase involved in cell wall biosynthesis
VSASRPRVLFINDVGFKFGAGVAQLRQVQSFLRAGCEVAAFSWDRGVGEERAAFGGGPPPEGWRGVRQFPDLNPRAVSDDHIVDALLEATRQAAPDLVVVGNLHAARWPLSLLGALRDSGLRVVAFMHDCWLVTGRCAYPGSCVLYETGCDETCPTADEYPALEPTRIPAAWRLRRELFCGSGGIPLGANSEWTLGMARRGLAGLHRGAVLYYGLDERLFRPIDRGLARRLLGVPEDAFVVAAGAVSLEDRRKGGPALKKTIAALGREARFVLFGYGASDLAPAQSVGYFEDFRKMPVLYSAADVFLGTSLEEAFGQTFCEAAACGIPSVGFRVGGVPEIARHDENARLVEPDDTEGLVVELRTLQRDPERRRLMGVAGRELVEREFTLDRQAERWRAFALAG